VVPGLGTKNQSNKTARIYTASLSSILPLPIANLPPDDPSHLNAYPDYVSGTIVLALYPETTSFYKAEVVASPREILIAGARVS
jgi:SAGA-associated factor 29